MSGIGESNFERIKAMFDSKEAETAKSGIAVKAATVIRNGHQVLPPQAHPVQRGPLPTPPSTGRSLPHRTQVPQTVVSRQMHSATLPPGSDTKPASAGMTQASPVLPQGSDIRPASYGALPKALPVPSLAKIRDLKAGSKDFPVEFNKLRLEMYNEIAKGNFTTDQKTKMMASLEFVFSQEVEHLGKRLEGLKTNFNQVGLLEIIETLCDLLNIAPKDPRLNTLFRKIQEVKAARSLELDRSQALKRPQVESQVQGTEKVSSKPKGWARITAWFTRSSKADPSKLEASSQNIVRTTAKGLFGGYKKSNELRQTEYAYAKGDLDAKFAMIKDLLKSSSNIKRLFESKPMTADLKTILEKKGVGAQFEYLHAYAFYLSNPSKEALEKLSSMIKSPENFKLYPQEIKAFGDLQELMKKNDVSPDEINKTLEAVFSCVKRYLLVGPLATLKP